MYTYTIYTTYNKTLCKLSLGIFYLLMASVNRVHKLTLRSIDRTIVKKKELKKSKETHQYSVVN